MLSDKGFIKFCYIVNISLKIPYFRDVKKFYSWLRHCCNIIYKIQSAPVQIEKCVPLRLLIRKRLPTTELCNKFV